MSDGTRKPVRLPFDFGDVVYHRLKAEKIPGMVTGFSVRRDTVFVIVTWANDLDEQVHNLYELTQEFTPDFSQET